MSEKRSPTTEILLHELDKMSTSEDQWRTKMKVFSELVEQHIEEEEGEIFKDAREVLSEDRSQRSTISGNRRGSRSSAK